MTRADINIEPMRTGQEDEFIKLYTTAFADPKADIFMPMMYPMGIFDNQAWARIRAGFMAGGGESDTKFCARDVKTGQLMGVSWWRVTMRPANTAEEIAQEYEAANESRSRLPEVPGMNVALEQAWYKTAFDETHAMIQGRPYIELRVLAVHADHQRKGVASALIEDGLRRADELHLPVLVISALQAKPIYERHGFDQVKDFPLDARDYNGSSRRVHWTMLRAARTG